MKERLFTPKILGPAALIWFAHFCTDFMIGQWSIFKTIGGLDIALAGIIAGVGASIGEGMQFVFGPLSDYGHRKKLMLIGSILLMANSLLGHVDSYPLYFLLFVTTCIGTGMFHPSAGGTIGDLSRSHRGVLFTFFASGGYIGLGLSHFIFSKVFIATGGSTIYLAIPSMIAVALIAVARFPEKEHAAGAQRPKTTAIFSLFKDPEMLKLYIATAANQAIYWGLIFMLPDLLKARGYPLEVCYGGATFALISGGALAMLPSGYLADRFSPRFVLIGSSLTSLFAFYFLLFNPLLPVPLLMLSLLSLGASLGIIVPVALALGTAIHPEKPGMVNAFLMGMVWCVAEFVGQGAGGVATLLFTAAPVPKALGLLGLLYFVSLYQMYRLPKPSDIEELAKVE